MNKTAIAFRRIQTNSPPDAVAKATEDALRRMGGTLTRNGPFAIAVHEGNAGISNAFTATFQAQTLITQNPDASYEIRCTITVAPNATFWVCAVLGFFCLWPAWIVNILYFMIDPLPAYQAALDQIQLPAATATIPTPAPTAPPTQPAPTAPNPELCANCNKPIGKLETPSIWKDHIVCAACYKTLSTP